MGGHEKWAAELAGSGSNPADGGPDSRESGRTVAGRIRQPDAKLMFDNFASQIIQASNATRGLWFKTFGVAC